ncbi:MAG: flagellar basal body P-ring formation chaperone FlgA [Bryobacteraceae bacterium]
MKILISFVAAATLLRGGCVAVEGDQILARDVAALIPEFARVPAAEVIGLAPLPTVRRVMSGGELVRFARKFGVEIVAPVDVCFETPTELLTRTKVLDQLKSAVAMDDVEFELIEFSRYAVPVGELSFPRSGLNVHPLLTDQSIVFWRGKVTYGGTKSFAVWARVRMGVMRDRLVAAETIRAGSAITAAQVRVERVKQFPLAEQPAVAVADVVDQIARRTIPAGQVMSAAFMAPPKEVLRGAEVAVEVKTDGARLTLPAVAESSGALGETVSLKNPGNGHSFRGVVSGKNQVLVTAK